MITVEKALQIVLDHTRILEPENVPILQAIGMVLAEDIVSSEDIPPYDMATIEGFALRSANIANSNRSKPATLKLDGEVKAGDRWDHVIQSGHALKVAAGAPLPEGVDSVISTDHAVRESAKKVRIYSSQKPGEHIFVRGTDIESGSTVLPQGKILGAPDIGVLGAIGRNEVFCYRKPRVSFFASGNDLISPDSPPQLGKLRAGNTFTLHVRLSEYGAEPINLGIFGINPDDVKGRVNTALESDMLIATAGSSFSDFDTMKTILQKVGMDLKFWRVAIRPGKPLIFGTFNDVPIFGFSSNILSSMVVLEQFIRPAIMKMQGRRELRRTEVVARLQKDLNGGGGVTHFVRAEVRVTDDGFMAIPAGSRNSPSIKAFSSANGFIVMPPEVEHISAGEMVKVQIISDPSDLN
jgi:molybdopterin molybdotransferase